MPKLTQNEIKSKADEWAKLGKRIERCEAEKNAELDPFIKKHLKGIQPILDHHDPKIQKLRDQQAEIYSEIVGWLNNQGKPLTLAGELAVATVETKVGSRVIDVKKFLEKAKDKGEALWDCVSVAIAKAEKLIGKTAVDEISTKDTKLVPSLKLK
jgi:hypothetical protein